MSTVVNLTVQFRGLPDIDTAIDTVRSVLVEELHAAEGRIELALERIGTKDVMVSFIAY